MTQHAPTDTDWDRLLGLLAPFHAQAAATARRLCRSNADGDDLLQEAVLRAAAKVHMLRDDARFRPWFYAVLLSVHRSRARRSFWRRFLSLETERERGFDPIGHDGGAWAEERRRAERAATALSTLSPVMREAIVLFELDGFSIEEIAAIQQVTLSAVKTRLARGRERLRRHYGPVLDAASLDGELVSLGGSST